MLPVSLLSFEVVLLFSDVSPKVKQIEGKTSVSSSPHDEHGSQAQCQ
jgi:hypothetical protein